MFPDRWGFGIQSTGLFAQLWLVKRDSPHDVAVHVVVQLGLHKVLHQDQREVAQFEGPLGLVLSILREQLRNF